MLHPLVIYPDRNVVVPPRYFGSVQYYAVAASFGNVTVDTAMRFDKRHKAVHRCRIVDTRDEIDLTVPVAHPTARPANAATRPGLTWHDIPVSTHGRWWHTHLTALESAYSRTPFFEYYIDRLSPVFRHDYAACPMSVAGLAARCDTIVRSILGLPAAVYSHLQTASPTPHSSFVMPTAGDAVPYWQIRADRLGFRGGLSILDLIFNLGPEAPLLLRNQAKTLFM